MSDPHPDIDQLVALALVDLEPAERERLAAHLVRCPACRDTYAELEDGLQSTLAATPAIAPSAGFSGRVLAAMDTPQVNGRRRTWPLVAAAAAVGMALGVGGTVAILDRLPERAPRTAGQADDPSAHSLVTRDLATASGEVVGSAAITTLAGRNYLLLAIASGRPGIAYECVLVAADGTRSSGGRWTLTDDYSTGHASGSWLVPISATRPARVELVGPSGTVWSQAAF